MRKVELTFVGDKWYIRRSEAGIEVDIIEWPHLEYGSFLFLLTIYDWIGAGRDGATA